MEFKGAEQHKQTTGEEWNKLAARYHHWGRGLAPPSMFIEAEYAKRSLGVKSEYFTGTLDT